MGLETPYFIYMYKYIKVTQSNIGLFRSSLYKGIFWFFLMKYSQIV